MQKRGGDQEEGSAIRPAAIEQIRSNIKTAFYLYPFLHIIAYNYIYQQQQVKCNYYCMY